MRRNSNLLNKLDWTTVGLYLLLVLTGWISIYAATYNEEHHNIFDITQRYGMQLIWIVSAIVLALIVMTIDHKFFSVFAYIIYGVIILLLVLTLFIGTEVNGSRSWLVIGPLRLQPAELSKVAASLALAKLISQHSFKIHSFVNLVKIGFIIGFPVVLIFMQHDTGSALVFSALLIMLYREGISGWFVSLAAFTAVLFILAIIWEALSVLLFLWGISLLVYAMLNRSFAYAILVGGLSIGLYFLLTEVVLPHFELNDFFPDRIFLLICGASLIVGMIFALKKKIRRFWPILLFFAGSVFIASSVDYMFNNMLKPHQRARIEDMLGLQEDLQGAGYNVHQSKVAIGSGGITGKGFLQGTQTRYNFVPEQSTDFIFCTIGEEWGFIGSLLVIIIYVLLLIRIIRISERQRDLFARIYGYCVLSILTFHVVINIAMTIGLAPVIGIPLPFISYGGSSLWAFTGMLFILLKFDAVKWN
ncbi:MAG: rod shape-determining protein RodA [Prevotellaceae bacterium]|jgi:rod shape determining protein RodA|nr:rod shape-determining protein RodA [Prevotellaceae bacterium]